MTRPSSAMPALAGADVPGASPPYLRGRWLLVARGVWLGVAALLIASFLLTLPLTFAQLEQVCVGAACDLRLRPGDLPVIARWGLSPTVLAAYGTVLGGLVSLTWIVMGVLLFVRRSAEPTRCSSRSACWSLAAAPTLIWRPSSRVGGCP